MYAPSNHQRFFWGAELWFFRRVERTSWTTPGPTEDPHCSYSQSISNIKIFILFITLTYALLSFTSSLSGVSLSTFSYLRPSRGTKSFSRRFMAETVSQSRWKGSVRTSYNWWREGSRLSVSLLSGSLWLSESASIDFSLFSLLLIVFFLFTLVLMATWSWMRGRDETY